MVTSANVAQADAVPPGPTDCPEGHESTSDHGGPYCRPPLPTNCPPEHVPRVQRTDAYCEPPPVEACPPGSYWTSESATYTYCHGGYRCEQPSDCGEGQCVDNELCVTEVEVFRAGSYEVVHGLCTAGCSGDDRRCVKAKRCDPATKRVASSPAAAKPVDPVTAKTIEPGTPGNDVPSAKPSSGCGSCEAGHAGKAGGAGLLLALCGLLSWRRRRGGGAWLTDQRTTSKSRRAEHAD